MITKITGEQPFQVLTNNFSISPSQEGYTLQISADGRQYSNLFTVGAGVTRLVTGVAANSYYRLSGNQSEVSVNWMKTCVTEGGADSSELTPIDYFPLAADPGTVVAYSGSSSAAGIYQFNGTDWVAAGGSVDLSAYWTSAQTQSAITAVEDHLFDVEEVTASALTELHDDVLELSARTVDLSPYWTSAQTEDAISAATSGKADAANISGRTQESNYCYFPWFNNQGIITGDTRVYRHRLTIHQSEGLLNVQGLFTDSNYGIPEIYVASNPGTAGQIAKSNGYGFTWANDDKVSSTSVSTIWKGTQAEYDAITTKDPNTFYIIVSN